MLRRSESALSEYRISSGDLLLIYPGDAPAATHSNHTAAAAAAGLTGVSFNHPDTKDDFRYNLEIQPDATLGELKAAMVLQLNGLGTLATLSVDSVHLR